MNTVISKGSIAATVKSVGLVIGGTMLLALGTGLFIIPFDLVSGGVSGVGIILQLLLGDVEWLSFMSAELYASVLNWILFLFGLIFLGKGFAAKTLISTLVYPFALLLTSAMRSQSFLGGFLDLTSSVYADRAELVILISTVFGGALIGAGCALTFLGGGSTGGTDIIALIACKYIKRLKSSVSIFILDSTVIFLGVFAVNDLVLSLMGIASAFICAIAVDKIFPGTGGAFIAEVISDKHAEINAEVIRRMGRTTTVIDSVGGYSGSPRKIVRSVFSMREYAEFMAIVSSLDKNAFVTVHRAHEIGGEGWTFELDGQTEKEEGSDDQKNGNG